MNVKGVTLGLGPMFASKRLKTEPEKMPFKSVWKLSVVQAKVADESISRVFEPIISTISKRLKMDTWRSDVFFSVGEAATSKWTHGELAVFGSTVYKIFKPKCQKLRTLLASLAPCVISWSKTRIFAASTITQYWLDNTTITIFFFWQCNHYLLDERNK